MNLPSKPIGYLSKLVVAILCIPDISLGVDMLKCHRDRSETRQFCEVIGTEQIIDTVFDSEISLAASDMELDLLKLVEEQKITIGSDEGLRTIHLKGLAPRLKMNINWSQHRDCTRSSLWNDTIVIQAITEDNTMLLDEVVVGNRSYDIDLTTVGNGQETFVIDDVSGLIKLSTAFRFFNKDASPDRPLAQQRIPKHCTMDVENITLGFDALDAAYDLESLEALAVQLDKLLINSQIIHNYHQEQVRGATCGVSSIAASLRDVEGLDDSDPWDHLSYSSKKVIKSALVEAHRLGALEIEGTDYWNYFLSEEFQEVEQLHCQNAEATEFMVSSEGLPEDSYAFFNAQNHKQYVKDLRTILEAAWALVVVNEHELNTMRSHDWLLESRYYRNH